MEEQNNIEILEPTSTVVSEAKKKSFLPLVLVIILVGAIVGGYFYFDPFGKKNTPKQLFISSIEKKLDKLSNVKEKEFNTLSGDFSINAKVSSPFLDKELLNLINKLNLSGKLQMDTENNKYYAKINATYDNSDLIKLSTYAEKDAVYLLFDDVLDKWVKMDLDSEDLNLNFNESVLKAIDVEKYTKAFDELKDIVKASLKDKYFTKEKFDGGSKIVLTIDDKNIKPILTDILKGLKDSKEIKNIYKDLTGSDTFKSDIDEILEGVKDLEISKDMGKILVSVYTNKKDEFYKIDITAKISGEDISLVLEEKEKDSYEFYVKMQGVKLYSGEITVKEDGDKTSVKLSLSMMEMINMEFNIEASVKYDVKLDKIDVSDSVKADDLTEKDLSKLEDLFNSKGIKKFTEDLNKIDFENMMGSMFGGSSSMLDFDLD